MSLNSKNSFWGDKSKLNKSRVASAKTTLFLVLLCSCILLLCWSAGHSFSYQQRPSQASSTVRRPVDKVVSQIPVADAGNDIGDLRNRLTPAEVPKPDLIEPNVVEFPELPSNVIETACQLIYQGKFDVADELLKQTKGNISGEPNSGSSAPDERGDVVRQISGIVHEYQNCKSTASISSTSCIPTTVS